MASVPAFLDGVGGQPDLNLADGIHPNAEGHRRLGAKLVDALGALIEVRTDAEE